MHHYAMSPTAGWATHTNLPFSRTYPLTHAIRKMNRSRDAPAVPESTVTPCSEDLQRHRTPYIG